MSPYTPGPWSWSTSCSYRRLSSPRGDGDVLHAVTQRSDGHPDVELPNGGWEGPDGCLIAAASEMYEALKAFLSSTRDSPELLKQASAALAKAEGREAPVESRSVLRHIAAQTRKAAPGFSHGERIDDAPYSGESTTHFAGGKGPHLLIDRHGNTAYCGGPGVCEFCERGVPPSGDHEAEQVDEIDPRHYEAVVISREMPITEAKRRFRECGAERLEPLGGTSHCTLEKNHKDDHEDHTDPEHPAKWPRGIKGWNFPNSLERLNRLAEAEAKALDATGGLLAVSPEIFEMMEGTNEQGTHTPQKDDKRHQESLSPGRVEPGDPSSVRSHRDMPENISSGNEIPSRRRRLQHQLSSKKSPKTVPQPPAATPRKKVDDLTKIPGVKTAKDLPPPKRKH